jgi:hypothetical protein
MSYVLWCTAKEVKLVKVPTGAGAGSSASSSSAGSVGGSGVVTKTKGKFATWVLAKKKHS